MLSQVIDRGDYYQKIPNDVMDKIYEFKDDLDWIDEKKLICKEISEDIMRYHRNQKIEKICFKECGECIFNFVIGVAFFYYLENHKDKSV